MAVHVRDVRPAARLGVELGEQAVGVGGLTAEVVGGRAGRLIRVRRDARRFVFGGKHRSEGVEVAELRREALVPQAHVVDHGPAHVAAGEEAVLVAEHVVHERVEVGGERGDVVEAVGREARFAVTAQVGRDHLEARGRERGDVAPPDALRLGVAVHEQQRRAAHAFAHVRKVHAVGQRGVMGREPSGIKIAHGAGVCRHG